jgi:hypothetical protein
MTRNVHLKGNSRQGSSPVDTERIHREKAAQTRRGVISDLYMHPVAGYINGDRLSFDCPLCREKQNSEFPAWLTPGIVYQTMCQCGKPVIVNVEGYLLAQRGVRV